MTFYHTAPPHPPSPISPGSRSVKLALRLLREPCLIYPRGARARTLAARAASVRASPSSSLAQFYISKNLVGCGVRDANTRFDFSFLFSPSCVRSFRVDRLHCRRRRRVWTGCMLVRLALFYHCVLFASLQLLAGFIGFRSSLL